MSDEQRQPEGRGGATKQGTLQGRTGDQIKPFTKYVKLMVAALAVVLKIALVIVLLPAILIASLLISMGLIDAHDTWNTPDITARLRTNRVLDLKTAIGGDLACAFSETVSALPMLTHPNSPFHGYSTNRWKQSYIDGVWSVVVIRKKERSLILHTIDWRIEPVLEGKGPCGSNLTIRLTSDGSGSRAIVENIEIANFPKDVLRW